MVNIALIVDFSLHVYGTNTPSGLNSLVCAGVVVTGAMFWWNGLVLIKMHISGDTTAPAHPLTAGCEHGIFLSASAKWFHRARMLRKLGCGFRLGGYAKSVCTASYEMKLSIGALCLYHYEASCNGCWFGRIVCNWSSHSVFLYPFYKFSGSITSVKCSLAALN